MPAANQKPFDIYDKRSVTLALENLKGLMEYLASIPVVTPCQACSYYNHGECRQWGEKIPADIMPVGCEKFHFNTQSIPF